MQRFVTEESKLPLCHVQFHQMHCSNSFVVEEWSPGHSRCVQEGWDFYLLLIGMQFDGRNPSGLEGISLLTVYAEQVST